MYLKSKEVENTQKRYTRLGGNLLSRAQKHLSHFSSPARLNQAVLVNISSPVKNGPFGLYALRIPTLSEARDCPATSPVLSNRWSLSSSNRRVERWSLVHCSNLDFGYDGLLVRRLKLRSTDWKSVVQVFLNPNS